MTATTIHASAIFTGPRALLVRGPAGAGKSRLVLSLLEAGRAGLLPFARLVGDDRVIVEAANGRLVVRPAPALAGLIEVRGFGIVRVAHEPVAAVGWVVDLAASDAARIPETDTRETSINGITIARLPVAAADDPLPLVLPWIRGGPLEMAASSAQF